MSFDKMRSGHFPGSLSKSERRKMKRTPKKKIKPRALRKSTRTKLEFNPKNLFLLAAAGLFCVCQYRIFHGQWRDSLTPILGAVLSLLGYFFPLGRLDNWSPSLFREKKDKHSSRIVAGLLVLYILILFRSVLFNSNLILGEWDMSSYYPYRIYWIKSLLQGDPALWNPYFKLGMPFASWPTVITGSPFNIFYLILPYHYAFVWEVFAHLFISTFGFYFLLRLLGSGWKGGLLAGMAFSFGGYFFSRLHQGQPHVWYAGAWAPWILWSAEKALREKNIFWIAISSLFCAFSYFEGFPQTAEYTLIILAFYLIGSWLFRGSDFKTFFKVSAGILIGFLSLCAVTLIPQSHYVRQTNRWYWDYNNIMSDYVTNSDLLIFLNPFHRMHEGNYHEVANYLGCIPLALFVAGCFLFRKVPRVFWLSTVAIFFLLLSMGASNPISKNLFDFFFHYFPLFNHHRVPGRLMIVPIFFMAFSAGLMLDYFESRLKPYFNGKLSWLFAAILLLTAVDLWNYGHTLIQPRDPQDFMDKKSMFSDTVMEKILADTSLPRIQPINSNTANLGYKLAQPKVDPEDTLLVDVWRYIQLMHENWDTPLSDLVAMKYIYAPDLFANPTARWQPLADQTVINTQPMPRAFVTGGYHIQTSSDPEDVIQIRDHKIDISQEVLLYETPVGAGPSEPSYLGPATITHYGNTEVEIDCDIQKPGILFLSDPYYSGWNAWVDGQKSKIFRADCAFRAVALPQAGSHHIRMVYQPLDLKIGLMISLAGWLVFGWVVFWKRETKIP